MTGDNISLVPGDNRRIMRRVLKQRGGRSLNISPSRTDSSKPLSGPGFQFYRGQFPMRLRPLSPPGYSISLSVPDIPGPLTEREASGTGSDVPQPNGHKRRSIPPVQDT